MPTDSRDATEGERVAQSKAEISNMKSTIGELYSWQQLLALKAG
jgi:hypothetical protein